MLLFNRLLLFALINAAVLGALLIMVLYSSRATSRSRALLAGIIGLAVWSSSVTVLVAFGLEGSYPLIVRSTLVTRFATIIMFYFYARSLIEADFHIRNQSRWHLLPIAVGLIWFFLPWWMNMPQMLEPSSAFFKERYLNVIARLGLSIPYAFVTLRLIRRYEVQVKAEHSTSSHFKVAWLKTVAVVFILALALLTLDVLTGPTFHLHLVSPLLVAGSLCAFTYIALRSSRLSSLDSPPAPTGLSDGDLQRLKEKLMAQLNDSKIFLNPSLRLKDLADLLQMKSYRVTEVINRGCHSNFNDLINGLRVENAKQLMLSPQHSHMSILAIAFESGFSSKSAFNEIFKRTVGVTPSRYRLRGAVQSTNGVEKTSSLSSPDA